jgi:hypothetical protein
MLKKPNRILWTSLLVAWFFDFLFWEKSPGISFAIFIGIALLAGFILARGEKAKPAWKSVWLLVPIIFFAIGTFLRREPFTTFTNYLLALVFMGVFAHTFRGGRWLQYSLSDYVAALFHLSIGALVKPIQVLNQRKTDAEENEVQDNPQPGWKRSLPIIRGILIAIPVVGIFAALLASADPIFAEYVEDIVDIVDIENLPEYIFRGVYITIFGYLLTGIYVHAFSNEKDQNLIGEEKPWLPNFLGFTEAAIVLGSVDALFIAFVGVQFRYFFGGQSNIKIDGYTYSEYAVKGFSELVWVAVFSLMLFIGLSSITKRTKKFYRQIFSGLGIGLMALVSVILVSAFRRLTLYEQVYGFTRLRAYSHIFMIWLGLLLAVVVMLELLRRQRTFALAMLLAAIGFVITLNVINIDGLITRQNVGRALAGEELDTWHLQSLSTDATPALIQALQDPHLNETDRNDLAAILACQLILKVNENDKPWQAYHWSDARSWQLLQEHKTNFSGAQVYQNEHDSWWVLVNGEERSCYYDWYRYD